MGSPSDYRAIDYTYDYADSTKIFAGEPTGGIFENKEHRRRMREWYGFAPLSGKVCPRRIVGKQCTATTLHSCICTVYRYVLDHPAIWTDTLRGGKVLTAEPFGINGKDIAALSVDLAELELTVAVRAESPYFPGRTVLLLIKPATH